LTIDGQNPRSARSAVSLDLDVHHLPLRMIGPRLALRLDRLFCRACLRRRLAVTATVTAYQAN
jgi:hypothetical protein